MQESQFNVQLIAIVYGCREALTVDEQVMFWRYLDFQIFAAADIKPKFGEYIMAINK